MKWPLVPTDLEIDSWPGKFRAGKRVLFEKRTKNFWSASRDSCSRPGCPAGQSKVFCFFFSKKKFFLPAAGSVSSPLGKIALAASVLLTGCDLAPPYHVPVVTKPASYAEAAPWHRAAPADALPRGAWWRVYHDATLDALEARMDQANPDLVAAAAVYDQARALAAEAAAGLYPSIGLDSHISANRQSARRPLRSPHQPNQYMDNAIDTQATYEIDFWHKVANAVKAGKAAAISSAANLETLRLSLHAELATDYFALRGLDAQADLLRRTVDAYRQALTLTQNRFAGKIASGMDVSRAATQLDDAEAQAADVGGQRALSAHAIAVLVGVPPSDLAIPPALVAANVPEIAPGLPASLLQRRPDIAAAERDVAAANTEIGVTRAAFYPNISLNLAVGLQDTGFNMFNLPDSFWSVGPGLTLPLFEGGLRHAEENAAVAVYRRTVAGYKSTVLQAFRDVEDQLALLHWLGEEQHDEQAGVADAGRTLNTALALYKDGATNFLDVVTAQTAELQAERSALDIATRRLTASVALIRALGGGWTDADLPKL
jgi:NodT family efflux transporter outer membrane factor (OMF) lipoprotein